MTPAADPPTARPDETTLPLLRAAAFLGLALTAWPAASPGANWYVWPAAFAAGVAVGALYRHPHRRLGFVPVAFAAGAVAVAAAMAWGWGDAAAAGEGLAVGVLVGVFSDARPVGPYADTSRLWVAGLWLPVVALAVLPPVAVHHGLARPDTLRTAYTAGGLVALAAGAGLAVLRLFRPAFELAVEPLLGVMYRVRAAGPGVGAIPAVGPCLVVANHSCWFDPFFLAKVLPRPVTPMMTARFYDRPVLRWLMRRVIHAIRVPEAAFRHDAPELAEAVAALDRGACVVIFPEGYLRRTEDRPLRRFGRGAWRILAARPDTPVVTCWIEGGWGSFTSYFGGRPAAGKRPDLRRRIGIGVSAPAVLDPATLAAHLPARLDLMNRVAAARTALGLPELPPYEVPRPGDEE